MIADAGAMCWPRTNIRVTSRHLDHLSGKRVVMIRLAAKISAAVTPGMSEAEALTRACSDFVAAEVALSKSNRLDDWRAEAFTLAFQRAVETIEAEGRGA